MAFSHGVDERAGVTLLLQSYASGNAERGRTSVALVLGDERVTYGELESRSNRLAQATERHWLHTGEIASPS